MKRALVLGLGLAGLAATPARADENYFGYSYGSETVPKGGTEAYLWATDRRGKGQGKYSAQDYRLELEHGFTDRFQVSGYLNFESHDVRGLEPGFEDVKRGLGFKGVQTAFKYAVLSPYKDGIGLAFYVEPGWSRINSLTGERGTEYELELKAILQKNFLDDRLIWVGNLTFEPEWEKEVEIDAVSGAREVEWKKEAVLEASTGLAYRVASNWMLGVEGRYTSIYPDWTKQFDRETYAVSAGPAIHYAGRKWWFTATYLPQLFGRPSPIGSRALDEYEKRELRLKVGYNF
ncbi:MAG: DUF6662 family protein [Pseudomonadota bacterium]